MDNPGMIALAILPIGLFFFLLLFNKFTLLKVSVITMLVVLLLTIFVWRIHSLFVIFSLSKGILIAGDILLIILGAIFFMEVLKRLHILDNVSYYLESISKDYRVQIIILAWFLENFIEGTAGFGTPSAVVAPLLMGMGLPALTAVVISLLGNSTSVAFGAAGTPIRVGFADLNVSSVANYTGAINCIGLLVPLFMLWVAVQGKKDSQVQFWEAVPFALWAGVAFVIPSWLIVSLGQEFPSILGSIVGLLLVIITIKWNIFVPRVTRKSEIETQALQTLPLGQVLFPYALLILLLILGKWLLGSVKIPVPGIGYSVNMFNPGWAFILSGFGVVLVWGKRNLQHWQVWKIVWGRTWEPFAVIAAMSVAVQLMVSSGNNLSHLPSMIELIAQIFKSHWLVFWAPFIGALGSFITGSATISNLMFGNFLYLASREVGINTSLILALEVAGAAAGNMIALADIMAAEAVVGLRNKEREVVKGVIWPCIIYVVLVGIVGFIWASII
jgi:lactate permease